MNKLILSSVLLLTMTNGSAAPAQQKEPGMIGKVQRLFDPSDLLDKTLDDAKSMEKQSMPEQLQVDADTYTIVQNLRNPFIPQIPVNNKTDVPVETPQEKPRPSTNINTSQPVQSNVPEIPKPQFNISGLVWDTDRPQAIIDNQVYDVGDTVNNWTIVEINKRGINVKFREQSFFLEKQK